VCVDDLGEDLPADSVHERVTVKEVVATQQIAEPGVDRLDELAAQRWPGMRYFAQYTRRGRIAR
jgi:hypothetical protein